MQAGFLKRSGWMIGASLGTGLTRRTNRDVVAVFLQVIPIIHRSTPCVRLAVCSPARSLGYECHHQPNPKTMRGAKSNALF